MVFTGGVHENEIRDCENNMGNFLGVTPEKNRELANKNADKFETRINVAAAR